MKVLKTTQSAFKNFIQDEVRSLPDADDRIFCTVVYAKWEYEHLRGLDYDRAWYEDFLIPFWVWNFITIRF